MLVFYRLKLMDKLLRAKYGEVSEQPLIYVIFINYRSRY